MSNEVPSFSASLLHLAAAEADGAWVEDSDETAGTSLEIILPAPLCEQYSSALITCVDTSQSESFVETMVS